MEIKQSTWSWLVPVSLTVIGAAYFVGSVQGRNDLEAAKAEIASLRQSLDAQERLAGANLPTLLESLGQRVDALQLIDAERRELESLKTSNQELSASLSSNKAELAAVKELARSYGASDIIRITEADEGTTRRPMGRVLGIDEMGKTLRVKFDSKFDFFEVGEFFLLSDNCKLVYSSFVENARDTTADDLAVLSVECAN